MAESIFIFKEVSVLVGKMSKLTYEQLFESAMMTKEFKGKKDASKLIDKKLREHGFKPVNTNKGQTQPNQSSQNRKSSKRRGSSKRKGNS